MDRIVEKVANEDAVGVADHVKAAAALGRRLLKRPQPRVTEGKIRRRIKVAAANAAADSKASPGHCVAVSEWRTLLQCILATCYLKFPIWT